MYLPHLKNKEVLQLLKSNSNFVVTLAEAESFDEINDWIQNEWSFKMTPSQFEYVKNWCVSKIEC
tara:strand:+ start:357 stop:551 length:195 start_codon:yes stop_codon:yes gene_type:complete